MSKKKIISAALATGLATSGVEAAQIDHADFAATDDIIVDAADQIFIYENDPDSDVIKEVDAEFTDVLIGHDPVATGSGDETDWFILAQTYYGGSGEDNLALPRKGGNITLDNGIKKGGNITLDNGIKRPGAVKLESAPKDRRKRRKGS